jgi:plastocyanin
MSPAKTLVFTFLAIVSAASAEIFQVDWDFIPNTPLVVRVGDTVTFTWISELHDVYIHPTLDCTKTGDIGVYTTATLGGSSTYTFKEEDATFEGLEMYFASDVRLHCEANTNQRVKVFPADVEI